MVKEGEPSLSLPSAAESDHNHSVEEETAVAEPLQKSKEILQKNKEILQKSKEILKKFKESYRTSQESKELLGVVDISMDIYHLHCSRESIPFGRPLSSILSVQTYFLKQFSKLLLINIVALVYRGALLKDLQLSHEFRNVVVHKRDLTLFTNNQSK